MKRAADLLTTKTQVGLSTSQKSRSSASLVNQVTEKMTAICPAWRSSVDSGEASDWLGRYKAELVIAMRDAGVARGEQINHGLSVMRSRKSPFLPSPGEFACWCINGGDNTPPHWQAYRIFRHDRLLEKAHDKTEQHEKLKKLRLECGI